MASTLWSVLMLFVVLATIPLVLWLLKQLQTLRPAGGGQPLQVMAQLPLGARERVVLVRVGARTLVLGVTAQQVTLLGETDALPQSASTPPQPPGFQALLRGFANGMPPRRTP